MKNFNTQKDRVLSQILKVGYVTRNQCLKNYITRLASIIAKLEKDGYKFEKGYMKTKYGNDYYYRLKSNDMPKS